MFVLTANIFLHLYIHIYLQAQNINMNILEGHSHYLFTVLTFDKQNQHFTQKLDSNFYYKTKFSFEFLGKL